MENENRNARCRTLSVLENVRCLECGEVYAKPSGGGTLHRNPGCPKCGYVGWIAVSINRGGGRHRSDADRPRPRTGRAR